MEGFDDVNYEITIKVRWMDEVQRFTLKKYQQFEDLMKIIAERENAAISQVCLMNNEDIIKPNDTPDSIGYKISMILSKLYNY